MINTLVQIAEQAGKLILDVYNKNDFEIEIKNDNSPLTEADKKSNDYITAELKKSFPGIPVMSEEGGGVNYDERKQWNKFFLVDPLDGTKEFIKRNGEFTVNIALIENKIPVLGVIHIPVTGETYFGSIESGSFKISGGKTNRIEVSKKNKDDELAVVQSRSHAGEEEDRFYGKFKIREKLSKGSSLKICLVAEGKAEIYFRSGPTMEWDTAAGHAILLGAGGYFVNKDGSPLVYNKEINKNFGFIASAFEI